MGSFSRQLSVFSLVLAMCVISLGAYTRLKDAGLGCPDWPGCYGQLNAPSTVDEIAAAELAFPQAPVETGKARTEMTHRYFASSLGSLIFLLSFITFIKRRELPQPLWLAGALAFVVAFQGALGMWTVTLKLLPVVVMGHLLGGFATLSLLWLYWLYAKTAPSIISNAALRTLSLAMLVVLLAQICLGGWTSANYAALICPDFPMCQQQWWPVTNFSKAFNLLGGVGLENPLAYMDATEKTTIHVIHRVGATITFLLGCTLGWKLWKTQQAPLRGLAFVLGIFLLLQVSLGIANVWLHLPLGIAVGHNFVAALLLLTIITITFRLHHKTTKAAQ